MQELEIRVTFHALGISPDKDNGGHWCDDIEVFIDHDAN